MGQPLNVLVARDIFAVDELADMMEGVFMVGILLTLAASIISGAIVSSRVLRRLETITRTSREIMAGNRLTRIPIEEGDRDFENLTISLNAMLARNEELMDGVRHVSDSIAHDMRTPLARLRQHLERTRLSALTIEEYRNSVDSALLETDDLLETFGALLRIAQIEYRSAEQKLERVDISNVCAMVVETYGPVAESENHQLNAALVPDLHIMGDRRLLVQMLVNLVENALQHNNNPCEVRILLRAESDGVTINLTVADDGVGIPPEERQFALKRFYRVDDSRSTRGNGLGLTMAAAIATYHKAALTLESNDPVGLRVVIRFASAAL